MRSLGRLYGEYPADFAVIEAELAEMLKNGAQSAAWTCRAPGGDGGAAWLRMTATLDGGRADGCPVFYLVLTDVSELAASCGAVSYTHLDVYKRQSKSCTWTACPCR